MSTHKSTTLLGVIGNPVKHSLSPLMHNAAIRQLGLPMAYLPFHIDTEADLAGFLAWMKGSNLRGVNVTVPYKEAVIPHLDELDDRAAQVGAVNTIVNENGRLKGYNTDLPGIQVAIRDAFGEQSYERVVVIGAGGAAKGVAHALVDMGLSTLCILNRNQDRAGELSKSLQEMYPSLDISVAGLHVDSALKDRLATASLVIQTTSVGMDSLTNPLDDMSWVQTDQAVMDIIYAPLETPFLQVAADTGAGIANGLGMLAAQAAVAFEHFTGESVSFEAFYQELLAHCTEQNR